MATSIKKGLIDENQLPYRDEKEHESNGEMGPEGSSGVLRLSNIYLNDLTEEQQETVSMDFDAYDDLFQIAHPSVVGCVDRPISGKTTWVTKYYTQARARKLFKHVYIVGRKRQKAYQEFVDAYGTERVHINILESIGSGQSIIPQDMDPTSDNLLLIDDLQEYARNKEISAAATQDCHHNSCTVVFMSQSYFIGNKTFRESTMYWLLFFQLPSAKEKIINEMAGGNRDLAARMKRLYDLCVYKRIAYPRMLLVDFSDNIRLLGETFMVRPCGLLPEDYPIPTPPSDGERKKSQREAEQAFTEWGVQRTPVEVNRLVKRFRKTS